MYAPDNSVADAFHRTLFVFICPRDECWGGQEDGAGPVLVLRSQLARDNPYYPRYSRGKDFLVTFKDLLVIIPYLTFTFPIA